MICFSSGISNENRFFFHMNVKISQAEKQEKQLVLKSYIFLLDFDFGHIVILGKVVVMIILILL
jgi:hypothetical protein